MDKTFQQKINYLFNTVDGILKDFEDDLEWTSDELHSFSNEWYNLLAIVKGLVENKPQMTVDQETTLNALHNRFNAIDWKLKQLNLENPFDSSVLKKT